MQIFEKTTLQKKGMIFIPKTMREWLEQNLDLGIGDEILWKKIKKRDNSNSATVEIEVLEEEN